MNSCHRVRWPHVILLPLLLLLAGGVAPAQSPLNVTIAVLPPYSPDLSVWLANPNRILITVQNQDPGRSYDFRLSGFAENTDGSTRIETKDEYPINALQIAPGAVRTLNLNDFKIFDGNAVRFKGADKDLIGRTKLLPEGVYRVCVRALEFKTLAPLSPQEPSGCATFVVRTADEPEPLQPTCGQTVKATKPQLLQFQWTIPPGAPPGAQYRFKMVPIVKGQSPQQAMKAATSPAFFEQTANGPTLLYGPADPPLTPGAGYAWQVQAVDPSGNLAFRNNGFSDVCSFQWSNVTPMMNDSITQPIKITDKPIDLVELPINPDTIGAKKMDTGLFIKADEIQLGKTFGCVSLTAMAAKQTELGQRAIQFAGYAEPGINLDAVTGAEVEVFVADRRSTLPYDLLGSKSSQPVFSRRMKGSVAAGIIATKGKGGARTHFELAFANGSDGFIPKKGVDYAWRFTLEFNGKTIRNDAVACADKRATSLFERFPDLIVAKNLPDTLIAGGFTIVVEDWDASSKSADPSRPSGIGRVKFDCNGGKKPKPWWFGEIGMIRKNFDVVGAVSDSAQQLAVSEAVYVEPTAKIGDVIPLDLPAGSITSLKETVINRNALIDIFKKNTPDGIRVAFRDVTWNLPTGRTEILTDGIAVYPSSSPIPTPPAEVALDSAFTLAIDSLVIRPASASVQGAVLLPTSIISNDTCTRARVPFPMTTITSTCEFYQEVADGDYGQWHIGETGLLVYGKGYTVDFSMLQSPAGPMPPLAGSWKGVKLNSGTTPPEPSDSVISNRGYVMAEYTFVNGLITASGFAARMNMGGTFVYHALDPFGYQINLAGGGYLRVASSAIQNGEFNNVSMRLPRVAISTAESSMNRVDVFNITLKIQADQDQFADLTVKDNLAWGEYSHKPSSPKRYYLITGSSTDVPAHFYLGARWMPPFYPLADTTFTTPMFAPATAQLETQRMQGVTIPSISNVPMMIVTRDRPNPTDGLKFPAETVVKIWMNVARTGVHTEVTLRLQKDRMGEVEMGPIWETGPAYAGEAPFKTVFGFDPKKKEQYAPTRLQFVESAVWYSGLMGSVKLPMPVAAEIDFKQMMFTSTAECAGGQVDLSQPDTMAYWGVGLVPKDPTKSAGILCVKLGVIYLTAAGFNEPRHFAKPFYLVWGEMKASGNMGRLAFDYNSVGQKFDRFGFSPELVKLSPYIPSDSGHVLAYGSVAINFFGAKRLSIVDYKSLKLNNPFNGRYVRVLDSAYMGAPASELAWQRNWGDGIANLDYDSIRYHVDRQDGFFGSGEVSLFNITGGMYSTIDIAAEGICFRVMEESAHTFALGPVAQMSAMGNIWGCGCIVGESLEKIALGGEISNSLGIGFSIAARGANMVSMIMSYSPTRFVLEANGAMFVNVGAVDLEVTGLASFTVERGEETFAEGYFRGTVNLGAVIAGVEGEGEFDWHLGTDYQSVQGRVAVRIWGYVGGIGAQTGIFFGHNVPKDRVWVMDGINGRFGLNKGGLPSRLTGFYAFLNVEASVSFFFLASGGFQLYVGVGAFVHDSPFIGGTSVPGLAFPYFVGNVGVRIWGEILGGLVSAAAWGNLQFTGAIPPAFEGTIGLEGCVLWVLCGSVDITCGYNRTDGFYMH